MGRRKLKLLKSGRKERTSLTSQKRTLSSKNKPKYYFMELLAQRQVRCRKERMPSCQGPGCSLLLPSVFPQHFSAPRLPSTWSDYPTPSS